MGEGRGRRSESALGPEDENAASGLRTRATKLHRRCCDRIHLGGGDVERRQRVGRAHSFSTVVSRTKWPKPARRRNSKPLGPRHTGGHDRDAREIVRNGREVQENRLTVLPALRRHNEEPCATTLLGNSTASPMTRSGPRTRRTARYILVEQTLMNASLPADHTAARTARAQRAARISVSAKKNRASRSAFSSESDAWMAFRSFDSA